MKRIASPLARLFPLALILILLWASSPGAQVPPALPEVIVKFRESRTFSSLLATFPEAEAVLPLRSQGGEVLIRARDFEELSRLIERLEASGQVEYLGVNVVKTLSSFIPQDPLFFNGFPDQIKFENQYYLQLIRAPQAWEVTTGSDQVVVALIDSGAELNHPDLAPNLWVNQAEASGEPGVDDDGNGWVDDLHGVDVTCNTAPGKQSSDCTPEEVQPIDKELAVTGGHGLAVAGLIAAVTDNGIGMSGVAGGGNGGSGIRLMVIRTGTTQITVADEIEAIDYAIQMGADIINMSFGGASGGAPEENAVNRAWDAGIVLVAASGNKGANPSVVYEFPAGFDRVIGVGATTILPNPDGGPVGETLATFTKWDPNRDAQSLVAPGYDMVSLAPDGKYRTMSSESCTLKGFEIRLCGTSFATPLVTGVAALVRSANPLINNVQVRQILETTADDLGDPGYDRKYGFGRVNAQRAVAEAVNRKLTGDLNGDGVVDEADLDELRTRYGARQGQSQYNRDMDLNGDGVIDELDALIIGQHYGESVQ